MITLQIILDQLLVTVKKEEAVSSVSQPPQLLPATAPTTAPTTVEKMLYTTWQDIRH